MRFLNTLSQGSKSKSIQIVQPLTSMTDSDSVSGTCFV
jgi:hypothetical protein